MDNLPAWQLGVPKDWQARVSQLIDGYTEEMGVSKGALAKALGFGKDISPSSFAGPFADARRQRLLACLLPGNLPVAALALGLDASKYMVLEAFFVDAFSAIGGWLVDPEDARGTLREAADWGFVGSELVDRSKWETALPYLDRSWATLAGRKFDLGDPVSTFAFLRVGTQLTSLDGYIGQSATTLSRLRSLTAVARGWLSSGRNEPDIVRAVGMYYTAAAIAYRHAGSLSAHGLVSYSKKAAALFAEDAKSRSSYVAAVRDQAKPLVHEALTGGSGGRSRQLLAEAYSALEIASTAAGGRTPQGEVREEWLYTRMTEIECRAAAGEKGEARRLWDESWELGWVQVQVDARRNTPLPSKCAVTEMALLAAEGRLDELGLHAEAYIADPANEPYNDRKQRVRRFLSYANEPDPPLLIETICK